jgi:carbamoyl-phosphate synthase large subunit
VLFSVNKFDKAAAAKLAKDFLSLGFTIMATNGTAAFFESQNLPVTVINKINQGSPHIADAMEEGKIQIVVNTPLGGVAHDDGIVLRTAAHRHKIPLLTTLSAAAAGLQAIRALKQKPIRKVRSLQEHHKAGR